MLTYLLIHSQYTPSIEFISDYRLSGRGKSEPATHACIRQLIKKAVTSILTVVVGLVASCGMCRMIRNLRSLLQIRQMVKL